MAAQALLPTPPRSEMLPLLPTPCGLALVMLVSAMSGRADFVERWDSYKKPCGSICSSSSLSSSSNSGSIGRADSVDRWDMHKKYKKPRTIISSSSTRGAGSPGRADSVERWDSKKLNTPLPDCSRHDGNNKRQPSPSRASSVERWDLDKKTDTISTTTKAPQQLEFAGPNFYASPEPSMLPMPSFFLLAH